MAKKIVVLASLLFFIGCFGIPKKSFIISGTFLEVKSPDKKAPAIVYEEFKRLDKIFNVNNPESEVSILNSTFNTPVKVSKELIELLELSQQLTLLTDGAFDVSYGALYEFWKGLINTQNIDEFPSQEKIESLQKSGGMGYVKIDPQQQTVTLKREGLKLDFSALAKGYMVDKAILKLKEEGVESALVNAGGDIYCLGTLKGHPWRVGIKNPQELKTIISNQDLIDEGIATSGGYEQFFEFGDQNYPHIIDPRTGYPVENSMLSSTVISKNCTTADGLATAFFVLGLEGVKDFLDKRPSTMKIFLITDEKDGKNIHFFQ